MGNPAWRFVGNERKYIEEVISNGFRAGSDGSFNKRLEKAWAETHQLPYAITFNSGTSALHVALLALGCGPGDEVLVPALSSMMCGLTPYYTGATPVYVDSDPDAFLMDPKDLERKITPQSKAIMVVHMYGGVCDMVVIEDIAKRHRLPILEDCAQCVLGRDGQGRLSGTIGEAAAWSFENSKQLTCGDGGIAACRSENLATKIRKIGGLGYKVLTAGAGGVRIDRDKLQNPDYERFDIVGYNYRMGELAAAVALAQAERVSHYIDLRVAMADAYRSIMAKSRLFKPQYQPKGYVYTYYTFSAEFRGEEHGIAWYDFRKKYMENGGDGIYAALKLLYQEPIFRNRNIGWGETPVAVKLQKRLMNFTTNQADAQEREIQLTALSKTLAYFGDKAGSWKEKADQKHPSILAAKTR